MDLLKTVGKIGCKSIETPIEVGQKIEITPDEPVNNKEGYQRLVGKLIYLTITMLDITCAINIVSQCMHARTEHHWKIVYHILQYLKKAPGQGIWYKMNGHHQMCGYTDADWASSLDRKSTTGYYVFVGGNIVSWKSEKQSVVSRSSAEVEYQAMATITSELTQIKTLVS
ncbi:secreted RxLR effector protein 161-like [Nymphaea colorata]|uniref:secreted RxLR effector protein 161-like n=1 Tax=Nymphaea colorata TaxID=210225 RepID=UPI00129DE85C|nr:secreted RxLR effector protein 161-like [Nymphaea colorata]